MAPDEVMGKGQGQRQCCSCKETLAFHAVTPAKAGVREKLRYARVPAFAGMTPGIFLHQAHWVK